MIAPAPKLPEMRPDDAYAARILATVPPELRDLAAWVCWKWALAPAPKRKRQDADPDAPTPRKLTKVPYNARTGAKAAANDPQTWAPFGEALAAYQRGGYAGLGLMFARGAELVGVDLDKCRDPESGELAPWALAVVQRLASYTEISPSGTGVHIILCATLPDKTRSRKDAIEIYAADRFFTMTGERLAESPAGVEERGRQLAAWYGELFAPAADAKKPRPARRAHSSAPLALSDAEIISRAMRAKNAAKFSTLWSGNAAGYASDSEADSALLWILRFYTQDAGTLDRLFRQSGLMRDKWDERHYSTGETYGEHSVSEALTGVYEIWTPRQDRPPARPAWAPAPRTVDDAPAPGGDGLDNRPCENVPAGTPLYAEILSRQVPRRSIYLHPGGTQAYELKATENTTPEPEDEAAPDGASGPDGGETGSRQHGRKARGKAPAAAATRYFRPAYPQGCPRLSAIVRFGDHEAPAGERLCYELEAAGVTAISSRKELHTGEWAERHSFPGVASRGAHAEWADLVEYQQVLCGPIPVHQGRAGTGWGEVDGRHVHALPNGVWYGEHGPLPHAKAYMHLAAEHLAAYADLDVATLAELHTHPNLQAQADALRFRAGIARRHLALLIDAAHQDSALYPLHRPDYGELIRGPSGRGKTLISGSGRNYLGHFGTCPPLPATGSFFDTSAAVERHATQLKHEPTTIDDLVIRREDGAATKAEKARTVRAILHSVGNNTPVRRRMSHSMQEQPSYQFETVPVLTSEELLPDMAESDLNRAIVLRFDELGIVDLDRLKAEGPRHEAGMLGAGLGNLAYIARRWNADGESFRAELRQRHADYTRKIHADMLTHREGQPLPSEADRLPSNGAHLLLALSVMQDYCMVAGVPYTFDMDAIRADLVAELVAQVDLIQALMTGSHNGVAFDAWVGGVLRRLADEGVRHITTPAGDLPNPRDLPIQPVRLGWRQRGYVYDDKAKDRRPDLQPNGALLAVTSRRCQHLCMDKHTLFDVLSLAATKDCRPFPATVDELLRELDRYHMIKREDEEHLERKITIGDKHPRRVWVKREIVWPDLQRPVSTQNAPGKPGKPGKFDGTPQIERGEADQNFPGDNQNFPGDAMQPGKFEATSERSASAPCEHFPGFPGFPGLRDMQSNPADDVDDDTGWPDESSAPSAQLDTWGPWDDTPSARDSGEDPTSAPVPVADRARRAGAEAFAADRNGRTSAEGDELI